jgi:hypothetical protein
MQHRLIHHSWISIIAVIMIVSAFGAAPAVADNTQFSAAERRADSRTSGSAK